MSATFAAKSRSSKSSANNYLFLFAQRTIAHQNEPPTPPPLNALGLPCRAVFLLWAWQKQTQTHRDMAKESAAPAEVEEPSENAASAQGYPQAAAPVAHAYPQAAPMAQVCPGGAPQPGNMATTYIRGRCAPLEEEEEEEEEEARSSYVLSFSTEEGEVKEDTFAEKIEPLARKIIEYIIEYQDNAAQLNEDRWRDTIKREIVKSFRRIREESGDQRDAIEIRFERQREEVKSRFDDVHSKLDEATSKLDETTAKLDETIQLIRNLVNPSAWPRYREEADLPDSTGRAI